uniref:Unconventional myosin-VIIb isoform X2 n=1 Tax=Geotrypetes seraphini TaxID=260995 RepID=A0A6P8S5G4_GEOSA|nr:unconventional myosin-VIIb isoform X2 [Geotrypetes seraphini]
MVILRKGDCVWLESSSSSEYNVPIGAEVKDTDCGQTLLVDDEGKDHWINARNISSVHPMHPTSACGVEDMIRLGDLNEAGIVHNLLIRHRENMIYTYIGSILVTVNPYQMLPLYTMEQIQLYSNKRIGELPPHIFAIADSCFFSMKHKKLDQCCVISGESGAGKTESTKLMLQFLASISGQHSWIEQQILEANPILEGFGNAKTVRNDNSSRFGKYIDIHFNEMGVIEGAKIEQFLLEKSRVCRQAPGERNYHIFYCMVQGMSLEQKKLLNLGTAAEYTYLTKGKCTSCEGRSDTKEYAHIRSAMKILQFSDSEHWEICKLLAAILHLGNIVFQSATYDNLDCCDVQQSTHYSTAAKLLEVDSGELQTSLINHSIIIRGESMSMPLSTAQASDGRDAFVKGIYGRLFLWIVNKINAAIFTPTSTDTKNVRRSIGLLDIFGFENFSSNSFEQFCINLANEHLQQFFVHHIFKMEQEEYNTELISWQHIDFTDNQRTLEVIALRSMNIISLIDEESKFPQGTDATMLNKLNKHHSKSSIYILPRSIHDTKFGINHFAGAVYYQSVGFLEKNRDMMKSDVLLLIPSSKNKFLKQLFQVKTSSSQGQLSIRHLSSEQPHKLADMEKQLPTLGSQFKQSLEQLMKILESCQPYFIRCIKPNDHKKPWVFDRELCVQQLRYSGMLETICIRKSGYPIRYTFQDFFQRYRALMPVKNTPIPEDDHLCCIDILENVFGNDDWKVGKTKIFIKDYHDTKLEVEREKAINAKAVLIQKMMRGFKDRKKFVREKQAAVTLQSVWRGYYCRKSYRVIQQGFERLQAIVQSRKICKQYVTTRAAIIKFQVLCRGYVIRKKMVEKKRAVGIIQAYARGMITRRIFWKIKKHKHLALKEREEMREHRRKQKELLEKQNKEDLEMVERIFGFLPSMIGGQEGRAPYGFEASLAVWNIILRFMGDLPEPILFASNMNSGASSVMKEIYNSFSKKKNIQPGINENLYQKANGRIKGSKEISSMKLKRSSRLTGQVLSQLSNGEDLLERESPLTDRPMSSLEKVHFIIGNAILHPDIRDEIYCQICKQLSENNNKNSLIRGWILMSLCLSCFLPTDKFIKYLVNFIHEGLPGYAPYCIGRLKRTFANGTRSEPPSWLELQATKMNNPIMCPVILMNGQTISIPTDPASTAQELCQYIKDKIKMKDMFGFSIYITMNDKAWSLGNGRNHLMDAISQCEQQVKERGDQERSASWRLHFRKEIFTPWHDSQEDPVSTDLIYHQIISGIHFGEFFFDKEEDFMEIVAKHMYIKFEQTLRPELIQSALQECIPMRLLASKPKDLWINLVTSAYSKASYVEQKLSPNNVKVQVVDYAQIKWPVLFSRYFEVSKFSGPTLPKNQFIMAINSKGISFLDKSEKKFLDLSFPEIIGIHTSRTEKSFGQSCTIRTLQGAEFVLMSDDSADIAELLLTFLDGLKKRSQYAVAMQDSAKLDDPTILVFKKGDLLILTQDKEMQQNQSWISAQNERTGKMGAATLDAIYIIPTLVKPNNQLVNLLMMSPDQRSTAQNHRMEDLEEQEEKVKPFTLEEFSYHYFRTPEKESTHINALPKSYQKLNLWVHSREPLKLPLLKKICVDSKLRDFACQSFNAIMRYMGDYPTKQVISSVELTDCIFVAAIKEERLRDEIYCQIMKQLTGNSKNYSVNRGWQLLWLCTGLFPPSKSLLSHAQKFMETRRKEPLAQECIRRIQIVIRAGCRKQPPHPVEVEAIQQMSTKILHKVYFPNETEEVFEVGMHTKVKDLCQNIASKLQLSSWEGFSIFVKIADKVFSQNNNEHFFDSLRHLYDWTRRNKPMKDGMPVSISYQLFFMRKLWINVFPGKDLKADCIFHYHQELPKYLRGYHKCSVEETVHMAGLIYKVNFNNDKTQLAVISKILKDLVPENMLRLKPSEDWKKNITLAYNKYSAKTVDEAKVAILKTIYRWPTFGSAFFEVKQTSETNFPEIVLIAINKFGISIIHPKTRELLVTHPFTKISSWNSGNTYFHITIDNLMRGTKILCETSLGYKMDDLITSYINLLFHAFNKQKDASQPA